MLTRILAFLAALVIGLQPIAASAQLGFLLDYPPNFVPQQFGAGSIVMDFANGGYYGRSLPDLTVSRASNETCPDSSGNYFTVGSNLPCIGAGVGINAWESRTNGIRNNSMVGAVAATALTPGTITAASRTASATAVLLEAATNSLAVGNLVTVSGCSVASYNGTFPVSAVTANTSFSYVTGTSTTDSATGCSYTALTNGTAPTNMSFAGVNGVGAAIVGTGTESGINYVDLRVVGTASSAINGGTFMLAELNTQIAATYGQTWAAPVFIYLVGGSYTNFNTSVAIIENNSSGSGVTAHTSTFGSTTGPLGTNRPAAIFTLTNTATAYVNFRLFEASISSGNAVDGTFRIGWPQLENNPLINSSVASGAQTVTNSGTSGCTSGTYTVSGGTGTAATLTGVASGGVITSLTTLSGGSYTVFPPSPAALTGTGCSGSPTATLAPTNNAAQGFATPPIVTSGSAATRAVDNISMRVSPGAAYTILVRGTPSAPSSYPNNQTLMTLSNGSNASSFGLLRFGASGGAARLLNGGGAGTTGTWSTAVSSVAAGAFAVGAQSYGFNGASATATSGATPAAITSIYIGQDGAGTGFAPWNGTIALIAVQPNIALPASVITQDTRLSLDLTCEGPWYGRKCRVPANDNDMPWRKVV